MDAVNIFGSNNWRYDEGIKVQGLQGAAAVSECAYGGQSSGAWGRNSGHRPACGSSADLPVHPLDELVSGYHQAASNLQSGEILLVHQLIGRGLRYPQKIGHHTRIQKQRQLLVVLVL